MAEITNKRLVEYLEYTVMVTKEELQITKYALAHYINESGEVDTHIANRVLMELNDE